MCAIIDMNVVGDLFEPNSSNFSPFWAWMDKLNGRVVYGGKKYKAEIFGSRKLMDALSAWKKAGKAREICDADVDAEQQRLEDTCESDDPHIIALARISGARVLILRGDARLERDFKNRGLIDDPRGRIYKKKITNTCSSTTHPAAQRLNETARR